MIQTRDGVDISSHGWPLSSNAWDAPMPFFLDQVFLKQGYRAIASNRRGTVALVPAQFHLKVEGTAHLRQHR